MSRLQGGYGYLEMVCICFLLWFQWLQMEWFKIIASCFVQHCLDTGYILSLEILNKVVLSISPWHSQLWTFFVIFTIWFNQIFKQSWSCKIFSQLHFLLDCPPLCFQVLCDGPWTQFSFSWCRPINWPFWNAYIVSVRTWLFKKWDVTQCIR